VLLRMNDLFERDRNHYLRVQGKGLGGQGLERLAPISPALYRRLLKYTEKTRPEENNSDRIFLSLRKDRRSNQHEPLTPSGILQVIRDLGRSTGIRRKVYPHLFRHSAATWMLQRGVDSLMVAQILGHSSLQMIQKTYSHLTPSDAHAALMIALRSEEG
ncbi:MAG: tyrosine-type recombinase/integrase, partial [Candidatus Dormibacteraceae bacterium]